MRFKGRGLIQLTGRENYSNFAKYKGLPDLLDTQAQRSALEAHFACGAAGFFWASKQSFNIDKHGGQIKNGGCGVNFWADKGSLAGDAQQVTKCINSAMVRFDQVRWPYFLHAFYLLGNRIEAPR